METAVRSGRLATADGIGRHRGLQKLAWEYRAAARPRDRRPRAGPDSRPVGTGATADPARMSRPGMASEEQRALSDRLARVLVTLERFVVGFARIGEGGV